MKEIKAPFGGFLATAVALALLCKKRRKFTFVWRWDEKIFNFLTLATFGSRCHITACTASTSHTAGAGFSGLRKNGNFSKKEKITKAMIQEKETAFFFLLQTIFGESPLLHWSSPNRQSPPLALSKISQPPSLTHGLKRFEK